MSTPMAQSAPLSQLRAAVHDAATDVADAAGAELPPIRVERSRRADQGDYATNVAMMLAPVLKRAPRDIAAQVGPALARRLGDDLVRYEIAGPGFVNLVLSDGWHRGVLRSVLEAGERFGAGGAEPAQRVLIEFVSANPTAPLVAASGQHAAYGDALARILQHDGHAVWREYYFNDAGTQITLLGESVQARARGEEPPEGGYQGEYIHDLAAAIPGVTDLSVEEAAARTVELLLTSIKATLERYGVHYDQFFSERTLHEGSPSYVDRAIAAVEAEGHTYRADGALWLRTTSFGDDKPRVLTRTSGQPTYFAADLGYMLQKRERGFDLQLLPLGADHHGYVARMKAAFAALGGEPDELEMPILQFVHLVEGGERAAMSKRRGDFVTLDELIDEIGVDATRFFMLQRSHDRTVDIDLDLARRESAENPVYYVQYAHARIVTMLGKLDADRVARAVGGGTPDWGDHGLEAAERELIKALVVFPEEVAEAAERRAPHRIAGYALELAQVFTAFYRDCRVVGAEPEAVESFRIALSQAARQTIKLALWLLGVSAPDAM
jgi:arginyl-tRNA synthetase